MHESTLIALREMRPFLRKRWEELLRAEPVSSPLASPDSLIYLMDWTLDRVFQALRTASPRRSTRAKLGSKNFRMASDVCGCGMNPLLAYFVSAERAFIEAVFLANSPLPAMTPGERQACVAEVQLALHAVGYAEIETFCSVCQRRGNIRDRAACAAGMGASVG